MKKIILAVVLVLMVIVAIWLLSSNKSENIEIGIILPKGESMEAFSQNELYGARLAVKEINNSGGVLDRQLELVEEESTFQLVDWQNTPDELAEEIDENKQLSIIIAGGDIDLPKMSPYLYRVWPSDALPVNVLVQYMFGERKYKNIAIVNSSGEWEESVITAFNKYSSTSSAKITKIELADDIEKAAVDLRNSGAEAAFLAIDSSENLAEFINATRDNGYKGQLLNPRDLTYSRISGNVSIDNLKDVVFPIYQPPNYLFVQTYTSEYGLAPGLFADTSYDAVKMLADAIKVASSTDPEAVRLSFSLYSGASGQILFNSDGERSQVNIGLMTFDGVTMEPKAI